MARSAKSNNLKFWLYISPAVLGFLVFLVYPLFSSLYLSFTNAKAIASVVDKFVGFANYIKIFTVDLTFKFGPALKYTFIYVLISVPLGMLISLALALVLNKQSKASGFFRVAFYLPSLLPAVAMSIMFRWLFTPGADGFINSVLRNLGFQSPPIWLGPASGNLGLFTIIFMGMWGFGGRMIIFLAALKGVPRDLYEASEIDGASKVLQFFKITMPMISAIFFYNLIMTTIGGMQVFNESVILGGNSQQTTFIVYYIYQTAYIGSNANMSYASAMAWVLCVIIGIVTAVYFKFSNRLAFYES